jgi:hypothetical protein
MESPHRIGKLARMTQLARRDIGGTLLVDGETFGWRVEREPQWCTVDGYRGLTLLVERLADPRRSLLIEYPFPRAWKGFGTQGRKVQRPQIQPQDVAVRIAEAMAQGYDPDRRGKPFLFKVGQN